MELIRGRCLSDIQMGWHEVGAMVLRSLGTCTRRRDPQDMTRTCFPDSIHTSENATKRLTITKSIVMIPSHPAKALRKGKLPACIHHVTPVSLPNQTYSIAVWVTATRSWRSHMAGMWWYALSCSPVLRLLLRSIATESAARKVFRQ